MYAAGVTTEEAVLQRWIGAVDQLAPEERPDPERLRAVAIELGLPDDVVELAEQRARELHDEALMLQGKGRHTDARHTLQRAVELVPWSLEMRQALDGLQGPPRARVPWGAAAAGLLVIVGGAMWLARPGASHIVPVGAARTPAPRVVEAPKTPLPAGPTELDLPLRIVGELPEGALLTAQTAYHAYPSQGSWNVESAIQLVAGAEGIAAVVLDAALVDAEGVIASERVELIGSSDPGIYHGERAIEDLLILSSLHRVPDALQLTVQRVQTVPGEGLYGPERVITGLPEGVSLKVHERRAECRVSFRGRVACEGVFVVENTGRVALDTLKLTARFGRTSVTDDSWVVATRDPWLAPGDRQPVLFIEIFEGEIPEGDWTFEVATLSTP